MECLPGFLAAAEFVQRVGTFDVTIRMIFGFGDQTIGIRNGCVPLSLLSVYFPESGERLGGIPSAWRKLVELGNGFSGIAEHQPPVGSF